jgi:hypothetical protein
MMSLVEIVPSLRAEKMEAVEGMATSTLGSRVGRSAALARWHHG